MDSFGHVQHTDTTQFIVGQNKTTTKTKQQRHTAKAIEISMQRHGFYVEFHLCWIIPVLYENIRKSQCVDWKMLVHAKHTFHCTNPFSLNKSAERRENEKKKPDANTTRSVGNAIQCWKCVCKTRSNKGNR